MDDGPEQRNRRRYDAAVPPSRHIVERLERILLAYFDDSPLAAWAAVNEVRMAAMYPEAMPAIHDEIKNDRLSEEEALLLMALRNGGLWAALERERCSHLLIISITTY